MQETKELGSVSRPWGRRGYSVPNLNLNLNLYSTPQQLQRPSSDELMNLRLRKVTHTFVFLDSLFIKLFFQIKKKKKELC